MKREHHHLYLASNQDVSGSGGSSSSTSGGASMAANGKAKVVKEEIQNDAGMDELLAVLGYKVRSSDMEEVAQKLEQLDVVMGNAQEDGLSQLASDTVHYNPSDLSTWVQSILSDLNPTPPNLEPLSQVAAAAPPLADSYFTPAESSTVSPRIFEDSSPFDDDLKAIPGRAIYSSAAQIEHVPFRDCKRLKPSVVSSSSSLENWGIPSLVPTPDSSATRPVVLVDSQENGIRLVHTLTACAEAVQQENLKLADVLVKQIGILAASQAGAMGKVAAYFAEALARRIYRFSPSQNPLDSLLSDDLQMHFYDCCPYLKFAHFTANQAILEAFTGEKHVHVIDFSMKQGMQWPALMQALALRPGGPPSFRLTGVGPPAPDNTDRLQEVGWKLAQLAKSINVEFEYRGFVVDNLADLDASTLDLRPGEALAVNSAFELHRLLAVPGDIERLLSAVREMKPDIVTVVEQEANHNEPVFLNRFMESLHYYSTLFDSLEGSGGGGSAAAPTPLSPPVSDEDRVLSEVYLGRQICDVVACEGLDRVERHEPLLRWRERFAAAGFTAAHLGSNAFTQASMLLALFAGGDGYRVEENSGCLTLGWHTRPLIATSAWKLAGNHRSPRAS